MRGKRINYIVMTELRCENVVGMFTKCIVCAVRCYNKVRVNIIALT